LWWVSITPPTTAAVTYTFPVSVSTTVIFNSSNCQLLPIGNVYIDMHHDSRHQYLSPSQLI
jgi:hypothetical protein